MSFLIIILIIIGAIIAGLFAFGFVLLLKALYYRFFATEKQLDNYLGKELEKTPEYSEFEKELNELI